MSKLAIYGGEKVFKKECTMNNKFGQEEKEALIRVVEHGSLSMFRGGPEVKGFEQEFADYAGVKYSAAATSGTASLHISLASLNLPKGSEVAVPALTFVSTASVVLQENLKPVFIDIDEHYCMDIKDLESKVNPNMKAVIPVHLYGHPADMDEINRIAKANNMFVIEDACQSHGAVYNGKKTGSLGDIGCFSFFETKNMTCGEGGMITSNQEQLINQIYLTKEHGSPRNSDTWYAYNRLGYNYNMTEMQGAIGRVQLKKLDANNDIRIHNAELYRKYLSPLGVEIAKDADNVKNVCHNMPILLPEQYADRRDFFVKAIREEGVPVDIAYPAPLYKTKLFTDLGYGDMFLKNVENMTKRMFTLFTDSSINEEIIKNSGIAIEKVLTYMKENE